MHKIEARGDSGNRPRVTIELLSALSLQGARREDFILPKRPI
jgi:hypothetical protein